MNILLFGGEGGHHNLGDFAMLQCAIERVRETFPGCHVKVWSDNPEHTPDIPAATLAKFPRLTLEPWSRLANLCHVASPRLFTIACWFCAAAAILGGAWVTRLLRRPVGPTNTVRQLLRDLWETDAVVNYGSGALNDIWPATVLYPWSFAYLAAAALGKPFVVTGQGIGPLTSRFERRVLGWSLNRAAMITLRDGERSARLLDELGVTRPEVVQVGDDAVAFRPAGDSAVSAALSREGVRADERFIAVQVRPTNYTRDFETEYQDIARLLDMVAEQSRLRIVFVPLSYHPRIDDRLAAVRVIAHMKCRDAATPVLGEYDAAVIKGIIARAQVALGQSYHFLLFALSSGIPAVGLYSNDYYRQKTQGVMETFGLADCAYLLDADVFGRVVERLHSLLGERESLAPMLTKRAEVMACATWQPMRHLRKLVEEQDADRIPRNRR